MANHHKSDQTPSITVPKKLAFSIKQKRQFITKCTSCNMPAYLFWKLQSHLVKLAHQLRRQKLKATQPEKRYK